MRPWWFSGIGGDLIFPFALLMMNRCPKAGVADLNTSSTGDHQDRLREVGVFQERTMFSFENETAGVGRTSEQVLGMSATLFLL